MSKRVSTTQMRYAGVPKSCWSVDCAASGLDYINEWATDTAKRYEDRAVKSNVYLYSKNRTTQPQAIDRVYLHARQLVANGIPGKVITFPRLVASLREDQQYGEDTTDYDLFSVLAKGFLAIPSLPVYDKEQHSRKEYDEAMGFLAAHIYEGGILIAAGSFPLTTKHNSGLPVEVDKLLFDSSVILEVV